MRRAFPIGACALALAALAACGGDRTSALTFKWTVNEGRCDADPAVALVRVALVANDGGEPFPAREVPCGTGEQEGVTFHGLDEGGYSYTIEALDSAGYALYYVSSSAWVRWDRDVEVPVDLAPAGTPVQLTILWNFRASGGAEIACSASGATDMILDFGPPVGEMTPDPFSACGSFEARAYPRSYPLQLRAYRDEVPWYRGDYPVTVLSNQSINVTLWLSNAENVIFSPALDGLDPTNPASSCAALGVERLVMTLVDWNQAPYETYDEPCDLRAAGFQLRWLPADGRWDESAKTYQGSWVVSIEARGAGQAARYAGSKQVTVIAGTNGARFPIELAPVNAP